MEMENLWSKISKKPMYDIKRWIIPPVFPEDEIKTRHANLLNSSLINISTLVPMLLIGDILGGKSRFASFAAELLAFAFCLILRSWMYRGRVQLASIGLITMGLILVTAVVASLGTIRAPTTAIYLLIVITGGFLFELRGMTITIVVSSLLIGGLVVLENTGLLPPPDNSVTITQWVAYSVILAWTGSLTFSSLQIMRQALNRADMEIIDRKKAEEALRESEQKFMKLFHGNAAAIVLTRLRDEYIIEMNDRWLEYFGFSREDVINGIVNKIKLWKYPEEQMQAIHDLKMHGAFRNRECEFSKKNGDVWTGLISAEVIQLQGEKFILSSMVDITDRKQAEANMKTDLAALTRMHTLSRKLLQPEGLQPLLQEIMDAAVAIMGAERGTLQLLDGDLLRIVAHYKHQKPFLKFAENRASSCDAMKRGRVIIPDVENSSWFGVPSLVMMREAGVRSAQSTPMINRTGRLLGILTTQWSVPYSPDEHDLWRIDLLARQAADLIEYSQADDALRRAHDELELRVQKRTSELKEANEKLEAKIKEQQQAEVKIREQSTFLDNAQEAIGVKSLDDRLIYWNKGAQKLYGWNAEEAIGKNPVELLFENKKNVIIDANRIVLDKGEWTGELHQITKSGKEVIVESHWTLIYDSEGKPKSILFINADITEKKMFEVHLLRTQRMESIGTLAGGLAHDLNNMLTPMMMSLRMLKKKLKDEQSQKLITILEQNSLRSADLIKQVLSFARGVEGERNPIQAKHIIAEIERVIKETFPRNIDIRTDISKDLFTISGDATQLHQVIMNLCVNARDAMPNGGLLRITASNFFIDENYVRLHVYAKVGPYIVISVTDTGVGIPPEIIDRIFEPFFTTKDIGKGTGLGLSTALAIVKSHGGFINVYSDVGKGSSFKVYLPAIKAEVQKIEEQQLDVPIGHDELILVAEDEETVREVTISTLKEYGYKVLAANNGAEALALYDQNKDKIKVVLMDMMMPVMDGETSIKEIRKINSDVDVIVVSGLAEKDKLAKIESTRARALLSKPYTTEKLLVTIHDVLVRNKKI